MAMLEQTTQTVGRTKFIVLSHFKDNRANAPDIKEKLTRIMIRDLCENASLQSGQVKPVKLQ